MSRASVYTRSPKAKGMIMEEIHAELARVRQDLECRKQESSSRQEKMERYKQEIAEMEARGTGEKLEERRREKEKLLAEKAALAERRRAAAAAAATQVGNMTAAELEQHREVFKAMYVAVEKVKREYERLRKSNGEK